MNKRWTTAILVVAVATLSALFVPVVAVPVDAQVGPNLAPNSSFETDPTVNYQRHGNGDKPWTPTNARTGTYALQIDGVSGLNRWMSRLGEVSATPGEIYRASVWAKTANVVGTGASLDLAFFDASNSYISGSIATSPLVLSGTVSDYTELKVGGVAPANATSVRIEMRLKGSGTVWFDDLTVVDTTAVASEPLPAPTPLASNDFTDYLREPGNQIIVVPNGTYEVDPASSPFVDGAHNDVDGEYLGWLILVAESPGGVVLDLKDAELRLQTPTNRILFVGMSFINGTVTFASSDDIAFWYTNHEYDPCVWVGKYRSELEKLTTLPDPGPRDPCNTGGGEYSDLVPAATKADAVKNIQGGVVPAPFRNFYIDRNPSRLHLYGLDVHNAGDDVWLAQGRGVDVAGMRTWDHAEYQGDDLETIDPRVAVFPTGFTDLIHSDSIEIATPGSINWTVTDSWTSRATFLGGASTGMVFENIWTGGSPHFPSRGLNRASDYPPPIHSVHGFNLGRPELPASSFEGRITNMHHVASAGSATTIVIQNLECGIRSYPNPVCVNAAAPYFTFSNITQGLPTGITEPTDWYDDAQIDAHLTAIKDHPDNPANVWRAANPYETWVGFPAFDFIPSYIVPPTGAPPVPTPPAFSVSPTDRTGVEGDDLVLSAIVTGYPTPTLQWRRNGVDLPGETQTSLDLMNVSLADSGAVYDVVATNSAGTETSDSATITVNAAPSAPGFTLDPVSASVLAGDDVGFSVAASGNPLPTLQWRRNAVDLPGETSSSLNLTSVAVADDGATYDVVATNSEGTATSAAATLSVAPALAAPVFTVSPASTSIEEGRTATLDVTVTGFPTPSIQWRRDGVDLPGETNTTLDIGPFDLADTGVSFDAVASNTQGTATSNSASITVTPGESVALFVAGSITPPSRDRHLRDRLLSLGYTVNIVDDDAVTVGDADNADLIVVSSSVWQAKVNSTFAQTAIPLLTWEPYLYDDLGFTTGGNTQGETGSTFTTIDIVDPSHPIAAGLNGTVTVLDTANRLSDAIPGGQVQIIAETPGAATDAVLFAYESGAQMQTFTAPARRVALFPNYLGARELNTNGDNIFDAAVEWLNPSAPPVETAPAFTSDPADLTVTAGAQATFGVAATGTPAPTLQWRRDGNDLPGETGTTLTIAAATAGDDGASFDVVATNTAGSATSQSALLTVDSSPSFTLQPGDLAVTSGQSVAFSVAVDGDPVPTLQWRRDGNDLPGETGTTLTIAAATAGDDGAIFDVVATNTAGSATSQSALLTVGSVPSFTTQPADVTVNESASASFSVAVDGSPAPTVQWRRDGVNLSGETGTTLTIASTTAGDDGAIFDAVATNATGSATSQGAELTVQSPPVIDGPDDVAAQVGDSATFSVVASGNPTPTLQWRRDGNDLPGETGSSLTLASVAAGDDGATFDVVATNSIGTATSSSAVLTVGNTTADPGTVLFVAGNLGPPYRDRKLHDRLVSEGYTVTKAEDSTVTAADAAGMDLIVITSSVVPTQIGDTFTDVDVPLVTWEPFIYDDLGFTATTGNESGATTTITIVDSVHPIAAGLTGSPAVVSSAQRMSRGMPGGDVDVIAVQTGNTQHATVFAFEEGADMAIGQAPARRVALFPNYPGGHVLLGGGYSLFDAAIEWAIEALNPEPPTISSEPQPVITPAGADATFSVDVTGRPSPTLQWRRDGINLPGETGTTLTLTSVLAADDGALFDVVATNAEGTVTSTTALLSVTLAPVFTSNPADTTAAQGANAVFSATVTGEPAPTLQWRRNGVTLFGQTGATLHVDPVGAGDDGAVFDVVATNSVGSTTSASAVLSVATAPLFTSDPASTTVIEGATAMFSATVTGDPAPALQWRRDGNDLVGETGTTLTVGPLALGDDGAVFDVVATNVAGVATSSAAALSVDEAPPGVTVSGDPTVTVSWIGNEVTVSWQAMPTASRYQFRYREQGQSRMWDAPTTNLSRVLTGVAIGTPYTYEVRALVGSSWGPFTTVNVTIP